MPQRSASSARSSIALGLESHLFKGLNRVNMHLELSQKIQRIASLLVVTIIFFITIALTGYAIIHADEFSKEGMPLGLTIFSGVFMATFSSAMFLSWQGVYLSDYELAIARFFDRQYMVLDRTNIHRVKSYGVCFVIYYIDNKAYTYSLLSGGGPLVYKQLESAIRENG